MFGKIWHDVTDLWTNDNNLFRIGIRASIDIRLAKWNEMTMIIIAMNEQTTNISWLENTFHQSNYFSRISNGYSLATRKKDEIHMITYWFILFSKKRKMNMLKSISYLFLLIIPSNIIFSQSNTYTAYQSSFAYVTTCTSTQYYDIALLQCSSCPSNATQKSTGNHLCQC